MSKFLDGTGLSDLITKIKNAFVAKADTAAVTGVGVDSTPTASSTNLVTSGGVYQALQGAGAVQDVTVDGTSVVANKVAVIPAIPEAVVAQELSIDSTPTANSANLVTSGGVASALSGKQATLVSGTNIKTINSTSLLGSGDIAISANTPKATTIPSGGMLPNVYYDLGWIGTNTSFTKNETGLDSSILNIWTFGFDVSGTPTISWPAFISWAGGTPPTITDGQHYEISIIKDYAIYAEFASMNTGPYIPPIPDDD